VSGCCGIRINYHTHARTHAQVYLHTTLFLFVRKISLFGRALAACPSRVTLTPLCSSHSHSQPLSQSLYDCGARTIKYPGQVGGLVSGVHHMVISSFWPHYSFEKTSVVHGTGVWVGSGIGRNSLEKEQPLTPVLRFLDPRPTKKETRCSDRIF